MNGSGDAYAGDPGIAPGNADLQDPERRIFHLRSLYEMSRELADPGPPDQVLKRFLPMAMGPLGASFGFVFLSHGKTMPLECLGLSPAAREGLAASAGPLVDKLFPDGATLQEGPVILAGRHLADAPHLPEGTGVVMALAVDADSQAVLGLGQKIDGSDYDNDEAALLKGMASLLTAALRKGCADTCIHDLNCRLRERNQQLEEAAKQAEQARSTLARRAFELQALFETTTELAALNEPEAILEAFTLSVMGTLGYSAGWVALYGPGEDDVEVSCRSEAPGDRERLASTHGRNDILGQFVALKDRMPQPHQCRLIRDRETLARLPVPADAGVLFALDHGWRGAVGLSSPLSGEPLSETQQQLLLSLTTPFIATLGNARQLRMVRDLNSDLAARNYELQSTLDALTSARNEISLLTEAKESILRLIRGEVARVERPSWLDAGLILLAGVVLGFLFNFSSPDGIPIIPPSLLNPPAAVVDPFKARRMVMDDEAVIIDARPADFYRQAHVKDAINLPKNLFNFVYSMKISALDPATPLVVYGRTFSRRYDEDVARELELLGHETVIVMDGGLDEWQAQGYEVGP